MLGFSAIAQTPIAALPSGGAVNTNVTPSAGTLAITGYAPVIAQTANSSLTPNVGALALTGYAPTLSQPIAATPSTGAVALTGYAPTLAQGTTTAVAPGAGSLSLTGLAPTLTQTANQSLSPNVGAVTLAGFSPSVTQSSAASVQPDPGTLTLTGYGPSLAQTANQALVPDAGAVLLTGYAPTVAQTGSAQSTKVGGDDVPRERIEVWTTRKAKRVERKVREELETLEAVAEERPEVAPLIEAIAVPTRAQAPDWSAYVAALQALEVQLAQVRAELEERDEEEALLLLL